MEFFDLTEKQMNNNVCEVCKEKLSKDNNYKVRKPIYGYTNDGCTFFRCNSHKDKKVELEKYEGIIYKIEDGVRLEFVGKDKTFDFEMNTKEAKNFANIILKKVGK